MGKLGETVRSRKGFSKRNENACKMVDLVEREDEK